MGYPSPDVQARGRFLTAPVTISLTVATAASAALKKGAKYIVWANVAWFFKQGATGVTAALTDIPLLAYEKVTIAVTDGTEDIKIAGILSASTGTAYIVEVS
jgi:hypothetical protein